jgi:hypothetical protein
VLKNTKNFEWMSFNNIEKTERLEKNKNFASRLSRTFVHLRVHRISRRETRRERREVQGEDASRHVAEGDKAEKEVI